MGLAQPPRQWGQGHDAGQATGGVASCPFVSIFIADPWCIVCFSFGGEKQRLGLIVFEAKGRRGNEVTGCPRVQQHLPAPHRPHQVTQDLPLCGHWGLPGKRPQSFPIALCPPDHVHQLGWGWSALHPKCQPNTRGCHRAGGPMSPPGS
ncbi:hypothetical protein LUU34_00479100 [Aix galericulata]|nr:hypothetical protein LUU34_00479100 [Aix galericulata]